MRIFKKLLLIIIVAALAVAGLFAYHYWELNKAYARRLADYRSAYAEQIKQLVAGSSSPEAVVDIHAFLAGETLNDILKVMTKQRIPLSEKIALELETLNFAIDNGTPLLALHGQLHFSDTPNSVQVRGVATFAPLAPGDGGFTTRLHIVALEPTLKTSYTQLALKGMFGDLVKTIGQEQLDKLPLITLPIRHEIAVPVKGSQTPISFKTRPPSNDTLSGTLTVRSFDMKSALRFKQAIFLPDGLHVFLQNDADLPAPPADPAWVALSEADRLKTLSAPATSYFARIRLETINRLIEKVTSLPKETRTVSFVSTGLSGHLYYWDKVHRGPFRTFLYREEKKAYLEHPDSARGNVELIGLALEARPDALAGLKLKAALDGKVQVHWHYDPGPSGGVGGNVGVTIQRKEYNLTGSLRITPGPKPMLEAKLEGPDSIKIDVSVGLGRLGSVGLDQTVALPKAPLFSAEMPTGLQETVKVKVGDIEIRRLVKASDLQVSQAKGQLVVAGKIAISDAPQ